ncbi:hypothetical protein M1L60_42420 [Actinoplanes sp. TRM 88003]|uniref:Uncharacterized protein n=1 Tax=Paractinoplanes aksuensis TaxID=2939490 RepID=A0ABT1E2I7_9ACTN|nr:hypothetical protein [Actinoplanes aksuensis]MCO8277252.1 hypothetical protein [Actinoplanes aksuensis]
MTGGEVPRGVRVATLLAWLMVPAGALLLAAGMLDLAYWASPEAGRLTTLMNDIETEYGVPAPAMIRGGSGAVLLVVLGAAGVAYGGLAPLIGRGSRWARSWGVGIGFAVFLIGLTTVGADASQPGYLRDYFTAMTWQGIGDRIPRVEALLYPQWYAWLEDIGQGAVTMLGLAVSVALIWAAISHAEHFMARGDGGQPDEWDNTIARMRANRRPSDQG